MRSPPGHLDAKRSFRSRSPLEAAAAVPPEVEEGGGNGDEAAAAATANAAPDTAGFNALHFAVHRRQPLETIEALVTMHPAALLLERAKDGRTPLHVAVVAAATAAVGDVPTAVEVVEYLAKASPDALQVKDAGGCTPLHLAAARGTLEVVQPLAMAWPQALAERAEDGGTPLHHAAGTRATLSATLPRRGRGRSANRTR
jgi:ankyrin repeat protein